VRDVARQNSDIFWDTV